MSREDSLEFLTVRQNNANDSEYYGKWKDLIFFTIILFIVGIIFFFILLMTTIGLLEHLRWVRTGVGNENHISLILECTFSIFYFLQSLKINWWCHLGWVEMRLLILPKLGHSYSYCWFNWIKCIVVTVDVKLSCSKRLHWFGIEMKSYHVCKKRNSSETLIVVEHVCMVGGMNTIT